MHLVLFLNYNTKLQSDFEEILNFNHFQQQKMPVMKSNRHLYFLVCCCLIYVFFKNGSYPTGYYPEHISHASGLSSEHAIAACCSSTVCVLTSSTTFLSIVNLIASVAAFVRR